VLATGASPLRCVRDSSASRPSVRDIAKEVLVLAYLTKHDNFIMMDALLIGTCACIQVVLMLCSEINYT
jgi:hypothetical protein